MMDTFIRNKPYTGPVLGVVLDWAGTTVDYGSIGPAAVFVEVFRSFGIEVPIKVVRMFMGRKKKDHIRLMLQLPEIDEQWRKIHGNSPGENEINRVYAATEPMMVEAIKKHCELVPGLLETVAALHRKKIAIGSSTGYTAPMMEALVPAAQAQGFLPDAVVCSSDVPEGRPFPWMCFVNALKLQVYPMEALVKVGDTISDIGEGLNAGMWTVGCTRSGNELGMTRKETETMGPAELKQKLSKIRRRFKAAGAHFVVDGIWDLMPVIEEIEKRLSEGQVP